MIYVIVFILGLYGISYLAVCYIEGEKVFVHKRSPLASQALSDWLQKWQVAHGALPKNSAELPQYKFYTAIIGKILSLSRQYGGSFKEGIWQWREGIAKDQQFDQEIKGVMHSGYAQFVMFILITWGFIYLAQHIAKLSIDSLFYYVIASLQFIGFALFPIVFKLREKKAFLSFTYFFQTLYTLKSLSKIGLPSSKVLKEARIENIEASKNSELRLVKDRILEMVRIYQQKGLALSDECQILLGELWFIRQHELRKFKKLMEAVKFMILFFFFVPAYFIFLFGLTQGLMIDF